MSVAGIGEQTVPVELTGVSYPQGSDGVGGGAAAAVLLPETTQTLPSHGSESRFRIEDVEEGHAGLDPQLSLTSPADATIASFGYNTAEAMPMTVYYRHGDEDKGRRRPSLEYLREGRVDIAPPTPMTTVEEGREDEEDLGTTGKRWWQFWKRKGPKKEKKPLKFGWIRGVLIRCLLNIWGVMLFIRLSWVVGQGGIGLATMVVLLSGVVTTITTLSMSAICTNGEVKGGGAYYLISRSLGPEFGGAIGIIFSLANAVAVALYVVGFAETVTVLMMENDSEFTGNAIHDIRIIGLCLVTLLLIVALVGLDWEAKVQIILLIVLLIAVVDFLIGTFIPRSSSSEDSTRGFTGYSGSTFMDNFGPSFEEYNGQSNNFFTVFAVFFPAATGILAGANISGDLKDPSKAIPKGTFLAIGITTCVYVAMAWLVGMVVIRDAPGNEFFLDSSLKNLSVLLESLPNASSMPCGDVYDFFDFASDFPECVCNATSPDLNAACIAGTENYSVSTNCIYGDYSVRQLNRICGDFSEAVEISCDYGLLNYFQVMEMVAGWGPLVTAGIFAATISSALASLVSAPKVFQRVCEDQLFPGKVAEKVSTFFAKGGGRSGTEPIRAYILTYVIALGCIAIGDLNEIALIISNFFLMAYALINYSCFAASFAKSPGWRPSFKYYSKWVALLGAALCVAIMFVIRWYFALITIVVVAALYTLVNFLKPDINWGSSTQAFLYSYSMRNLLKLEKLEDHVKNFRPQFLVLCGPPSSRPDMVHFFSHLSREVGVMVCGQVLLGDYTASRKQLLLQNERQRKWLRREKIKAFHNIVAASSVREGTRSLLQLSGLGKIRPNTLVLGYKNNWPQCPPDQVEEYISLLHDAFDLYFGVVIFRLRAGFDATELKVAEEGGAITAANLERIAAANPYHVGAPRRSQDVTPHESPLPSHDGLRMRNLGAGGMDSRQPLLGASGQKEMSDVSLSSLPVPSGALGAELTSRRPPGDYLPIEEEGDHSDSVSIDSYTLAMEAGGYPLSEEDQAEERAPSIPGHEEGVSPELITMPSRFETTQEKGNIDVWWLYDDGGLAILLPYLLSRHALWKNCKLRIFTAGSSKSIDQAKLRMASMLRKFRIDYSTVIEVTGINKKPSQESIDKYRQLPVDGTSQLDAKDLDKMTLRHIRLGELLHEHSSEARLIVITISVPQRTTPAWQYMSWLEVMSQDLPPILMMRGNQASVLTFYS